jgi:polygalacturonase
MGSLSHLHAEAPPNAGEIAAYPVTAYGAVADPLASSTAAIQKAIDAAHAAGGGTVTFPPGRFLSGTLELKSGVTLDLQAGSTCSPAAKPRITARWEMSRPRC